MTGYLTLAQSQAGMEHLIVEMVQAGVERQKGARTASGFPILANDPHLEVNRLPAVWYEVVARTPDWWTIAETMPGLPAFIAGRNPDLAWGVTYSFLDGLDSWIERCREGRFQREDAHGGWKPFARRVEIIRRKGRDPVEAVFWENDHGVLDGDPQTEGMYLATRWSAADSGAASLSAFSGMWDARSVDEGRDLRGRLETSWSWVFADRRGSIAFQMSGLLPRRRPGASGLGPLPGWDPANDWQGFADPAELPRCLDPEDGFFVTANHDLNAFGRRPASSVAVGPYRADRIAELLRQRTGATVADMQSIQLDLCSKQAREFLAILRPRLPDTPEGRALAGWDLRYDPSSRGAALFERFYRELHREVFGRNGLDERALAHLEGETGVFTDFYHSFDRVLLSATSAWFGGEPREEIWRRAADRALTSPSRPWGAGRRVTMSHILFGGKMPAFLGFDRGPFVLPGGRATVRQGQVYRSAGRVTTFAPSFRMVTDLGTDEVHTVLAGGASDRRFSRWYVSDLKRWLRGEYKTLAASQGGRHPL
jgi:penicillin amidase